MSKIHYAFMLCAVIAWLTIFNSCTSEQKKIEKPRLETVLEASERHMDEYERFRKSPAYTPGGAEDFLRSHISALQDELRIGAEENRQLQRERNDWQAKFEDAKEPARKWNTMVFSVSAIVIVSGVIALLALTGYVYIKLFPAGAAANAGSNVLAGLLALFKR